MIKVKIIFILCFILIQTVNCRRPGRENANLDKKVGIGQVANASISTKDGLASIRSMEPGSLTFWLQAPVQTINLDLVNSSISSWTIVLLNAIPGMRIQDTADIISFSESQDGTTYSIELDLSTGNVYRLFFAPDDYFINNLYSFAMMADVQEAIYKVEDIFYVINQDTDIRFVTCIGDLTSNGTRAELNLFINKMAYLDVPVYSTPGNHENIDSEPGNWHRLFGRFNVHFVFKGAAFSLVDSSAATIDPAVYEWLNSWIINNKNGIHSFFTHYPPIDPVGIRNGSFRSRNEAYKLLAILADGNVDSSFYGHVHSYYKYSNAGITAYIAGGGGAIPDRYDGIGRHYLKITVNAATGLYHVRRVDVD